MESVTQLSILDPLPPAQAASVTSIAAARSMRGKTGFVRDKVLTALRVRPMTDSEIAQYLGLSENTTRPRRIELVRAGSVVQVTTTRGVSGREMGVWGPAKADA